MTLIFSDLLSATITETNILFVACGQLWFVIRCVKKLPVLEEWLWQLKRCRRNRLTDKNPEPVDYVKRLRMFYIEKNS